jgi:hypothetical protein
MFKKERERLSVLHTGYQMIFEKETESMSLSLFQRPTGNQYIEPKVSLSLFFKYHLVNSIQNRMIFAKERERETFGFVYWLPGDV